MSNVIFIIILIVLALFGFFVFPSLLLRRAINQIIKIFRQHSAIDAKHARTAEELGLGPQPSYYRRMFWLRDYKPSALQQLMNVGIIQMTEDDRLYLSEENMAAARFQKRNRALGI
ncbi:hypothetical protein ES703_26383 [subsurface metagenome]